MRIPSFLLLVIMPLSAVAATNPKPTLFDGTAAAVGSSLVTVQDAYFYRAMQRFKENEKNVPDLETGEALRRTVQKLVFEEMVSAEIKSLQFEVGSRPEVEKMLKERARGKGKGPPLAAILKTFGRSEANGVDVLFRSLQAERFLQKKVDTLTPIVTEAEAERYYNQNVARFKGSSYEALKPNIILLLKKERMQKGLEEWVLFLREKYGVISYLEG